MKEINYTDKQLHLRDLQANPLNLGIQFSKISNIYIIIIQNDDGHKMTTG